VRFVLSPDRKHEIRIEHSCCAPWVKQITAAEAARSGELRVPLEPRMAHLRVDGAPTTRVYVDGRLAGTAGDSQRAPLALPVPAGGDNPYEATAQITLEPAAGLSRTVPVRLRAGGEATVAAPEPETSP
jgi:eukaryotic-like serine/threonine-protein kinase